MGNAIADKIAEYGIRIEKALNRISGYVDPEDGGSATGLTEKDVNFYDYDGTLLYAYTTDEFLALEDLPAGPDHSDRGWTFLEWSVAPKKMVSDIGSFQACAIYETPVTTIKLNIADNTNRTVNLIFSQSVEFGVEVDFGEGGSGTFKNDPETGYVIADHVYSAPGEYTITLTPIAGNNSEYPEVILGANEKTLFAKISNPNPTDIEYAVTEIVVGSNVSRIEDRALRYLTKMKHIMISDGVGEIGANAFTYDVGLKALMIPSSVTSIGSGYINNCFSLQRLVVPFIEEEENSAG